ncbi:MAG: hypothetical protein NUW01_06720, partial [Gemmatimonadaceae bacterium]|nr:hypothetical protein [Gemmatimonadaceae bacterium]
PNAPTVEMLRDLASARVRFIVIGGVAAQLLGSPRVTRDLDILYDTSADNLGHLADVLTRWRAYLRGVEPGLPFIPDAKTIKAVEVLTLDTDFGWFDILQRVAGIGAYADAIRTADSVALGDFTVNVLSLESLIRSKLATGRPRDKTEVLELEALRDVAEQHRAAAVRLVARVRAQQATDDARRISAESGTNRMPADEINSEISAARRASRKE